MTMGQLSAVLRNTADGHGHWCPGCEELHVVPAGKGWTFDGNIDRPTFSPSVKITYNGADAGQVREGGRRAPYACCHYFIKAGQIEFCGDSTHGLAGQTVPMPNLPPHVED